MATNIYSTKFQLDAKGFIQQSEKAGESFAKFSGTIQAQTQKIIVGLSKFQANVGKVGIAIKGLEALLNIYKKALSSTGTGQDELKVQTAMLDAGVQGFFERLSNLGGLDDFNTSIGESISAAAELQKSLNSFDTLKFSSDMTNMARDVTISMLKL
jgi:hypothetical protein